MDFHHVAGDKQLTEDTSTPSTFGHPVAGDEQLTALPHLSHKTSSVTFSTSHQPEPGEHGFRQRLSVIGGTAASTSSAQDSFETSQMNQHGLYDYATTADLLMQNLTMIIGNPSQRCFANAPWRAFTWLCAFLQEHNLQPWGTIRDAVQESLETSEAVDLHTLPGLQSLWKQHDLNIQGDASHFVNSLWIATQSRAFTYRYPQGPHPNAGAH